MGTKIEIVSSLPHPSTKSRKRALWLSKKTAELCFTESGLKPIDLDMLIFAGIYREDHIGEPSIASLLQKEIGANPEVFPLENRTFSFDVDTGGCSLVNAIQLVDGFISSGKISMGMVITGDSEPFRNLSESYNFISSSSSIILTYTTENIGFKSFKSYTYLEFRESFKSYIAWKNWKRKSRKKNVLVIEQSESYLQECLDCSLKSLADFLIQNKLDIKDIDLIIPSQSPAGLPKLLEKELNISGIVVGVDSPYGEIHTSGPGFALNKAWENGKYQKARNIIFLSVGAGISNILAWYKK